MFKGKKIKLVTPDAAYSKTYLHAAEEFAEENKISKTFLVTRINKIERTALNTGTLDFHKRVVVPCQNPFGEDKKSFSFWIIAKGQYIGEVYIKDKILEKSSLKRKAHPQYKWNEIYQDDVKRYTTAMIIIRPSARNYHNLILIACVLHQKLNELGFDEFIMNCYKSDKSLNYKLYRMNNICGGQFFESEDIINYIFPVRPEAMNVAVDEKIMTDFINTPQSFENFLKGLKAQISEDDFSRSENLLQEEVKKKVSSNDLSDFENMRKWQNSSENQDYIN